MSMLRGLNNLGPCKRSKNFRTFVLQQDKRKEFLVCFLAAVPTYAVVDKSAKKGSEKDKKVKEQKPQTEPPQHAAVDKSKKKKKKKEEPEATYAQVDMSKKSKKVCQWLTVFFTSHTLLQI